MKKSIVIFFLAVVLTSAQTKLVNNKMIKLNTQTLLDKVKGGWAGQVIGCTYGGPTEFRFQGSMIQDYQIIPWPDGYIKQWYENEPGLYDDVYMDLTFVDVIEKYGLDAPVDSFAKAFAMAEYPLWHANQAARYNILNGIMAPQSGNWLNNPHADCIDFQIEADFAGLMSPGMPNSASEVCDKVGHIMNYGDGWYGGVYVASMYSLAFVSNNIPFIVTEALKSIPKQSLFNQCINDVIKWHKKYPTDWKATWFEVQKKWTEDVGCPDGVFTAFNIDARVNSAYIVIGLLYGKGDLGLTMDIAARCGQDSDCNPASAAGILGTAFGYSKIAENWKKNLKEVEDMDFKFTTYSLNEVYMIGYKQAVTMIEKNGGSNNNQDVIIKYQTPKPVRFEKSFGGMIPLKRVRANWGIVTPKDSLDFEFEGNGIAVTGFCSSSNDSLANYIFRVETELDGVKDTLMLPIDFKSRKHEIFWKYQLPVSKHKLKLRVINRIPKAEVIINDVIVYSDKPIENFTKLPKKKL